MFAKLLAWFKATRFHESVSHCLEGFLIFLPCALLARSWWVAALCVMVWYWSRKKLECEYDAMPENATDASHVDTWAIGWFPWQWSRYQVLDVVLPAAWFALLAWPLARLVALPF